ncbi:flagellar biosynthetic protein FliR [Falsochrobactrum shanghaiense]|uniref:Flagellar biosynthetic protein FliR n=1 Tax=Falsochrobactrum shanghaiense TaxID=2201899 RepID=A0A316J7K5_9HYPH|nr:flagellar biosynthetic protein FliR [Falsochrobactrum shanghaiense]PWL17301.1 flagellar biosynthetic protein FliR [Falsochrobactrum shanghaiense]
MPIAQLPLNEIVFAAMLAVCRVGACLMLMPGLSSARIPLQVRLFIALACSFAVLPLVIERIAPLIDGGQPWTLLRLMASEMFIGAMIGILAQIYFWALQFMANMMAMAVGYSGAPADAITETEPQATLATIVTFGALLLFFVSDLHLEILRALLTSYAAIPLDGQFRPDAAMIDFADALSAAFLASLRIAAPFIVFAILVNFAIGLVNKLTPTIPVYFVSMPFVLGGGLLLAYFILPELLRFFIGETATQMRNLF